MPAPSAQPQWDSNLTHTTPTVAGHKTDGLGASEVPASDEFNYWMNLVYQWVKYLAQRDSHPLVLSPAIGAVVNTVVNPGYFNAAGNFFAQHANDVLVLPIPLETGSHITQVVGLVEAPNPLGLLWDMKVWKKVTSVAGGDSVTQIGTTQTCAASGMGTVQAMTVGSLNETVAVDTKYLITFSVHAGATVFGTAMVNSAEVTYDIPAI